jgi:hypothetical protein
VPDHKRVTVIAIVVGVVVFFVSGLPGAIGVTALLFLAHISDQLAYLIRQRQLEESNSP